MRKIRIAGTEFSLKNKSFEIYMQGCYRKCAGCHNPDTQPFDGGKKVDLVEFCAEIKKRIEPFDNLIENIYITGGDLLCQDESIAKEISEFICYYFSSVYKIWLFTGAKEIDLPEWVWIYYDVVKCGRYDENKLNPKGSFPASKNQKLLFNGYYKEELEDLFNKTNFMGVKEWR